MYCKNIFYYKTASFCLRYKVTWETNHLNWVQEELEFWGKSNQWTDNKHLSTWADVSEYKVIIHWLTAATFAGIQRVFPAFFLDWFILNKKHWDLKKQESMIFLINKQKKECED